MSQSQKKPHILPPDQALAAMIDHMDNSGTRGCERCLDYEVARRRIASLCKGAEQWASLPIAGLHLTKLERSTRYLLVCYSNPDSTGIPNHICVAFPVFRQAEAAISEPDLLVCFA